MGYTFGFRRPRSKPNAVPTAHFFDLTFAKTFYYAPLSHGLSEARLLACVLALGVTPPLPRLEQRGPRDALLRTELALILEEALDHVGLRTVLRGRRLYGRRRAEPVRTPLDAAPNGPRQHTRQLLAQFLGELRVRLLTVEALAERDQANPVPYRLRAVRDLRLVVRRHPQRELRPVGERLAVRRAGADGVVIRNLLDGRLLQLHAALRLRHADEPHALKLGKRILRGGVPVSVTHHNVGVRGGAVVPHEVLKHLHQRALGVLAHAVQHRVLPTPCNSERARSLVEPVRPYPRKRRTNAMSSASTRVCFRNFMNLEASATGSNSTGASLVINSSGRCGRREPVRRSTVPFSTLSSIGSVPSSSGETARSAFASVHIALRHSKLCERLAHSAIFFCSSSSATRSASRKFARAVSTA